MGTAIPPLDQALSPVPTAASEVRGATVGASVDLGSNSVHVLVAEIAGHQLQPIVDESVFLGLGAAVAERGYLGFESRQALIETLAGYADLARRLGAGNVTFIGTEPIRRAADAARIVHEGEVETGVALHVLSHEEEAYLTLIGVMEGRPVAAETLVVDVGGGSSEFCVVDRTRPPRAAGLKLGSARLTDRWVKHDPPTATEMGAMREVAREALGRALVASPREIVAVGGTASNLLKLLPAARKRQTLTRDGIAEAVAILSAQPAELASERYLIRPTRTRILPAGAAIFEAVLDRYGMDHLRVSEAGIREGTILAVDHAGVSWRDQLPQLAHGWRT